MVLGEAHPLDIDVCQEEWRGIEPEFVDHAAPMGVGGDVEGVVVPLAVGDDGGFGGGVFGDDDVFGEDRQFGRTPVEFDLFAAFGRVIDAGGDAHADLEGLE